MTGSSSSSLRKSILFILIAVMLTFSPLQGYAQSAQERRTLPGEQFVKAHMFNENGTLRTNLKPDSKSDPSYAYGHDALSESMGLWLQYAFEKSDYTLFFQGTEAIRLQFTSEDGWLRWKINANPEGETVTANALIDDLRIVNALYEGGSKWKMNQYNRLARTIADRLTTKQVNNGLFTDYYDIVTQKASGGLTISYLDTKALAALYKRGRVTEALYRTSVDFLSHLPERNGFFPISYDTDTDRYVFEEEVHLVQPLLVALHRAYIGVRSDSFFAFLKESFYKDGLLYGKYDMSTKEAAVDYESPAVYGIAILLAMEESDEEFAKDLYYRMIRHQSLNPESEYYGGYVDPVSKDTHIFDNLYPLLAERRLYNSGILY